MARLRSRNLQPSRTDGFSEYGILQRTLKSYRDKARLLETIILANPFPMAVWDLDGRLVLCNRSCIELFGAEFLSGKFNIFDDLILRGRDVFREFSKAKRGKAVKIPVFRFDPDAGGTEGKSDSKWIESVLCPIVDEKGKPEYYLLMYVDVTESIKLRSENAKLRKDIDESLTTHRNVASLLNEEKQKIRKDTVSRIRNSLLERLIRMEEQGDVTNEDIEYIEKNILAASGGSHESLASPEYDLTPTEIRICGLLRNGLSGKETAGILRVNYSTIHSHTKSIRKKLRLTGSGKNLQKYLLGLSFNTSKKGPLDEEVSS